MKPARHWHAAARMSKIQTLSSPGVDLEKRTWHTHPKAHVCSEVIRDVYGGFICNSQTTEVAQKTINGRE